MSCLVTDTKARIMRNSFTILMQLIIGSSVWPRVVKDNKSGFPRQNTPPELIHRFGWQNAGTPKHILLHSLDRILSPVERSATD